MMTRMNLMNRALAGGIAAMTVSAIASACPSCGCSGDAAEKEVATLTSMTASTSDAADGKTIVETAVGAGSFNTLVAAVQAAGLVDALNGDGPVTVFAPTDEAFSKLPKGTLESLLLPENKGTLTSILTFHVVSGDLSARDVMRTSGAKTLSGQRLDFNVSDSGSVMINGATVKSANIDCSNGTIHVIDTVILPASDNIADVAASAGVFNTLLAAADAAGLVGALTGDGPLTVLAPTDDAFAKLPAGTVESLLKPENKDKLAAVLKYHVIAGRAYASDAAKAGSVETLLGEKVMFSIRDGRLTVDGANIVKTDIDASNGVVHIIDRVILPQG